MRKFAITAAAGLAMAAALPAQALLITFGGQNALDNSGLTSSLISNTNQMPAGSGFFVETFDVATYTELPAVSIPANVGINGTPGTAGTTNASLLGGLGEIIQPAGANGSVCSINAWGGPTFSATGGGFGIRQGSTGGAAAPANDDTCFAYGPQTDSPGDEATVKIDYSPILAPGVSVDYLGIYYGSIDTYNSIRFYSGEGLLTTADGFLEDGVLEGEEILEELGGSSGNQTAPDSNVYVNLFFSPGETFTAFEFVTDGRAVEFDNVVVGLNNRSVPAPAPLALLGLGLLTLLARRRK
jgi:hypothetical protein